MADRGNAMMTVRYLSPILVPPHLLIDSDDEHTIDSRRIVDQQSEAFHEDRVARNTPELSELLREFGFRVAIHDGRSKGQSSPESLVIARTGATVRVPWCHTWPHSRQFVAVNRIWSLVDRKPKR